MKKSAELNKYSLPDGRIVEAAASATTILYQLSDGRIVTATRSTGHVCGDCVTLVEYR